MLFSLGVLWSAFFTILICAVVYLYLKLKQQRDFWPNRGFHYASSKEIGGVMSDMLQGKNITCIDKRLYNYMKDKKEPYAGYVEFGNPVLFVTDVDLIRNILIKDFDHFVNRRDFNAKSLDPLAEKMIFFMESEPWKNLRNVITPTFTTGKIRRMFAIMDKCGERLVDFLTEEIKTSDKINFAEGYGKYTVDVIANAAFGIESGAYQEKKSIFERMAAKIQFNLDFITVLKFILIFTAPKVAQMLKITLFNQEASNFFSKTINNALNYRRESGEKRDDFLQLMLEASSGQLKLEVTEELDTFEKDAIVHLEKGKNKIQLTDDTISAQSMLFFLAGYDTTLALLQFAAYELAIKADIQEKLATEILDSWKQNGGKFTYDSINQLEYMEKFLSEILRMYPPISRLERKCTKDYKIPGTDLTIPAGVLVAIPSFCIHYDETIHEDPYRFDPERFSKSAKMKLSPYSYMPFGHGPRNCIGMRFALTESKLAIAHLILNFKFEPTEKTPIPMKFAKTTSLKPEGGMWIKLSPRPSLM